MLLVLNARACGGQARDAQRPRARLTLSWLTLHAGWRPDLGALMHCMHMRRHSRWGRVMPAA
jgi:hypothetical protein